MIWLIGNKGMLGTETEKLLKSFKLNFVGTDSEVDITDIKALNSFINKKKFSWIINCAAYTNVDKAEKDPELAFKINSDGPLNLAKISRTHYIRILHISTDYVFNGKKDGSYQEEDAVLPKNIYGLSKLLGEKYILNFSILPIVIRTSWMYGIGGHNFVYAILKKLREQENISVVSDQYGSPTYAKDLASLIVSLTQNGARAPKGLYHYTNKGITTWYDFAKKICEFANDLKLIPPGRNVIPISFNEYKLDADRPLNSSLSKEKIEKTFSLKIPTWESSLKEFLEELKNANY